MAFQLQQRATVLPAIERANMRTLFVTLSLVLLASSAHAQGVGITAVNLRQYVAGASTPVTAAFTISVASVTCNLTAPVPPPPASLLWADPVNAGKVCQYIDPGTGPLFAKVYGALEGTLTNVAGALESPESARAPFTNPPVAPTAVQVRRQ